MCQNGDKEAFHNLISKYHSIVYKFLIKITENANLSEDLTQETFLKVIRNIDKFDLHGKAKFSTYMMTIARNCYIDELRRSKGYKLNYNIDDVLDIPSHEEGVEEKIVNKIYGGEVAKTLESLTKEQRIVIKLKYIEGLTLKEISGMLDLEPKTIKSRIHNGIVKLRNLLLKRGEDYGE
jgi:RNA polymerase sigma-70 factor (ECF subfamily)